ncbi:MAG: hypothetical protein AAF829_11485 [Pseudomonadota bacterium]
MNSTEFLDRLFDVIRDEARANPAFAARLVKAAGGQVTFTERDKVAVLNPLEVAAEGGPNAVRSAFETLDPLQLRTLLKEHNLASAIDVRSRGKADLLDMLAVRATARVASRSSMAPPPQDGTS